MRDVSDLKRGLYLEYSKYNLERKLIDDSLPVTSQQKCEEHYDNPKKGLYCFVLHTLLMSANCYTASAIFNLNPNVSVI